MERFKLHESEYRFAQIIWGNEPIPSGELVTLCEKKMGWKKSTTYTVLKRLCNRNILKNKKAIVTSLVKMEQVQKYESEQFVGRIFGGSLPQFIAAFMDDKRLSNEEAEELKRLIDSHKEG